MIQRSSEQQQQPLLEDQECITPKGPGRVCGVRYCDILKRIRVSVILDVEVDGKKYHVFDRYAVKPITENTPPVEIKKEPAIKFGEAQHYGVAWRKRK